MFDFKIIYKLNILTAGKISCVCDYMSPEIVSDDTRENITQKISSQFI
jgi:hypothetical protein